MRTRTMLIILVLLYAAFFGAVLKNLAHPDVSCGWRTRIDKLC